MKSLNIHGAVRQAVAALLILVAAGIFASPAAFAGGVEDVSYSQILRSVRESRGRVVVVTFFASWCQPCLKEIPELKRIRSDYAEDRLDILGVSVDEDKDALENLVSSADFNYPIVRANAKASNFFGIRSIPRLMIYDAKGVRVFDQEGYMPGHELRRTLDSILTK